MQQPVSEDVAALWARVRDELEASLPASTFRLWLRPLKAVSADEATLYLSAPEGIRSWVERRYAGTIAAVLSRLNLPVRRIGFVAPDRRDPGGGEEPVDRRGFDDFVIGIANRFAHGAALATAEIPGEAYNPLFLHGPPGVGKTHLLTAIASYLRRRHPGMVVRHTTAERFTTEFVASVRRGRGESFQESWREVDALLIDDVQFLEDKVRTGEEFFHTFNALHQRGSQIVLSSDRPPRSLSRLTERLRDRFEWGLCAQLDPPDLATRVAVLQRLAENDEAGLAGPDRPAVLREIASQCSNLRQLEGALTRVVAFSSMMDSEPTVALVRDVLDVGAAERSPVVEASRAPADVEQIQDAVCNVLHISRAQLTSRNQTPAIVRARQLAIYVARERLSMSLGALARAFGRDRSTILHSIRTVEQDLGPCTPTSEALERVVGKLASV